MNLIQKNDPGAGDFYDVYASSNKSKRTLYLLGSYEGRLAYYRVFMQKMIWRGYRIVYLQPGKEILSTTHPKWLGDSINQATRLIESDMSLHPDNSCSLVSISLGSYLGLNIMLRIPFKKFVVIAGGAPLGGVFRTAQMFQKARNKLTKNGGLEVIDEHWQPFDEAFKEANLKGTSILMINSNNDTIIGKERPKDFITYYSATGTKIINHQTGNLSHIMQAFSINWRTRMIDAFIKSK